jgi:hypothetical protein
VRPLPAAAEASAYRIVQESLTTVLKHAPGAAVRVVLRYTERALEVVVAYDGAAAPAGDVRSGGHGLVGIRERMALCDGRVSAGGPRRRAGRARAGRAPGPGTRAGLGMARDAGGPAWPEPPDDVVPQPGAVPGRISPDS